jgi:crossover junction endodeoxyribonuclease RusA
MVQKCVDLKQDWQWQAKSQWKGGPLPGDVHMTAHLYHGTKRERDIDNFSKLLLDALTGIVYEDDSQIVSLTITKAYDKENPRVDVEIHTV